MDLDEATYPLTLRERIVRWTGPQRFWLHIGLFVFSIFTTSLAGVEWKGINPFELTNLPAGFEYSFLLLLFLTAHEFGHFIAARIHNVDATLPFYIPFPGLIAGVGPNFGTFGAVIKTRSRIPSRKVMFDIGVAGPIAGFIVCLLTLIIGFMTLPGIEYLQQIHPGYPNIPSTPHADLRFGSTLLFTMCEKLFARSGGYVPPMTEVYHYPMLCVGWFGLFVTSLNLLPVGQLDGGHLMYGLCTKRVHRAVGMITAAILFLISIPDLLLNLSSTGAFHTPGWLSKVTVPGGSTWLLWALIVTFFIRFKHPETLDESPLDTRRVLIGIVTILIFVLCFTPSPLVIE